MNRLMKQFSLNKDSRGVVLVTILVIGMVITLVALSLADLTTTQYATATKSVSDANALLVAEAGIEESLTAVNVDNAFSGYSTAQEFFNNKTQGRGIYTSTVTSEGGERIITATGTIYGHGTDRILSQRKVRVSLVGTSSEGYSVYTGAGGLILSGGANITNSEVYVQGKIILQGGAKIGSKSQPLNINAANIACPDKANPGPTYPSLCGSSSPAVTVPDWTKESIVGRVCATNQTQFKFPDSPWNNDQQVSDGNGGNGFVPGCVAPEVEVPTYDRGGHLSQVTSTINYASNPTYNCNNWTNANGWSRTWPADVSFTGNASIASSCEITVNGNIHFTGNLVLSGGSKLRVPESAGSTRPVILVDGTISIGAGTEVLPNSQGTTIHFVSTKSTASCSPACTNLTGTNLYNSQNATTINVDGGAKTPGVVVQAVWGKVTIGGGAQVGAVIGQKIEISGGGSIVFGTKLSSGTSTWTIRSYQQIYD